MKKTKERGKSVWLDFPAPLSRIISEDMAKTGLGLPSLIKARLSDYYRERDDRRAERPQEAGEAVKVVMRRGE